jgi:hypothetical protein
MSFPHLRSKPIFLGFLVADVAIGVSVRVLGGDVSKRVQPSQASFQNKNEFKVQSPKGAKSVRMWFEVPREDAASVIREFRSTANFPVHYFRIHRGHTERHLCLSTDSWRTYDGGSVSAGGKRKAF